MLNLTELYELLEVNKKLTLDAMRVTDYDSTKRLTELAIHRNEVKNCIIELLNKDMKDVA